MWVGHVLEPAGKGSFFFYLCRQLVDTPVFWMLSCSFVFAWFCLEQIHECSGFCWIHFFLLSWGRQSSMSNMPEKFLFLRIDDSFWKGLVIWRGGLGYIEKSWEGVVKGYLSLCGHLRGINLGQLFFVVCFKVRGISLAVSLRGIHRLCFLEELTSREAAKFFFV